MSVYVLFDFCCFRQLLPGCGIHLIMMGFSMMQVVVDVSPAQFVNIFKVLHLPGSCQQLNVYSGLQLTQTLLTMTRLVGHKNLCP